MHVYRSSWIIPDIDDGRNPPRRHRPHRSLHQQPPTRRTPPRSDATSQALRRIGSTASSTSMGWSHGVPAFSAPTPFHYPRYLNVLIPDG
jgi:hypothetical protein